MMIFLVLGKMKVYACVCVCLSLDFSLYIYDVQCYLSIHSLTHPLTYSLIPSLGPIFLHLSPAAGY